MEYGVAVFLILMTAIYFTVAAKVILDYRDLDEKLKIILRCCNNFNDVRDAKTELSDQLTETYNDILTEIACLATKNNTDIQRVREGYKPGDVIEYDGEQYVVLKLKYASSDLGLNTDFYRLYNMRDGEVDGIVRDEVDKNSKLLRHVDLSLEDKQ